MRESLEFQKKEPWVILSLSTEVSLYMHSDTGTGFGPDGDVVHDLSEHGGWDDRLTLAGQQRIHSFIHHLSLQQPAVEWLPWRLNPCNVQINSSECLFSKIPDSLDWFQSSQQLLEAGGG